MIDTMMIGAMDQVSDTTMMCDTETAMMTDIEIEMIMAEIIEEIMEEEEVMAETDAEKKFAPGKLNLSVTCQRLVAIEVTGRSYLKTYEETFYQEYNGRESTMLTILAISIATCKTISGVG